MMFGAMCLTRHDRVQTQGKIGQMAVSDERHLPANMVSFFGAGLRQRPPSMRRGSAL
jgi:hypothetical protein